MKVRANQNRSLAWHVLAVKVRQLSEIVDRDSEITDQDLREWKRGYRILLEELDDTYQRTLDHVLS